MEIQNDNKKITFPNRNYSDIVRFYINLYMINSPELKEIEKILRSQIKSVENNNNTLLGTAWRLEGKSYVLILLITDFQSAKDFGFLAMVVRKQVFTSGGNCINGEFFTGLESKRSLDQSTIYYDQGKNKIVASNYNTSERISQDTFFELIRSYQLLYNFIHKV